MFDSFKLLNYSNSLVSPELYARHLSRLFSGNVVDGLTLVPKTGLTVTLQPGNGFIPYGSGATASVREFSLVADFDITLDTADASNPRIDLIVIYVDMAVSLPGGTPTVANLDGPSVVKATFVKGTPNASPVEPTVGAIQTKIGASNPYIIVESVRVDALVGTIAANKITDRRTFAKLAVNNIDKTLDWWEEVGRSSTVLAGAGGNNNIEVVLSKPCKYITIVATGTLSVANAYSWIRFNGVATSNYQRSWIQTTSAGAVSGTSSTGTVATMGEFDWGFELDAKASIALNRVSWSGKAGSQLRHHTFGGRLVSDVTAITSVRIGCDNSTVTNAELVVLGHN